ncbi:hypothetical protein BKA69DRAFT_1084610 [Paraphysoderma sedebokerense]|nr:hypothetical protein BKA69DRAFT_1084610 [Paraphysoderma sedebokerense]
MSASQRLVSELMILAGKLAAQFAFEHKIPVPYRVQDPLRPDIESLVTKFVNEKGVLPFPKSVDMISGLGSAGYSLYPGGHSQMGILDGEGYVKITSPLRRYLDTFVHWQFDCYFASQKNPGFDGAKYGLDKIVETAELRERLANITAHEKRLRLITRQRERFWYLWCLRERENQGKVMGMQERLSYTGVVGQMDKNDTAFTVRLWQGPVGKIYKNRTDGGKWNRLESGQWVQIEVDELDLWSGRLTWRLLEVL